MEDLRQQIEKRRTFAIISHPDAGKTTLTEKFLLYGGAIQQAGTVKGKKNSKHATSDWMEIEKQRGISHLLYYNLIIKDIVSIFWILQDIKTSRKILIVL